MADIFDTIEMGADQQQPDIFDQVATSALPKRDVFDHADQLSKDIQTGTKPEQKTLQGGISEWVMQQPLVQEAQKAFSSPGGGLRAAGNLVSGLPLAATELGDMADGLMSMPMDAILNAVPDKEVVAGVRRAIQPPNHLTEKLKMYMPSTNTAMAQLGSTAAQMAIPIGGGASEAKNLGQAALEGAKMGGLFSGVQNLGQQYEQNRTVDVPQLLGTTALGAGLGGAGSGVVHSATNVLSNMARSGAITARKVSPARLQAIHDATLVRKQQAAQDLYHQANDAELKADTARRAADSMAQAHAYELHLKAQKQAVEDAALAERDRRWQEAENAAHQQAHQEVAQKRIARTRQQDDVDRLTAMRDLVSYKHAVPEHPELDRAPLSRGSIADDLMNHLQKLQEHGKSIREKAVDLRHTPREVNPARPTTAGENKHLSAALDAKVALDHATHNYHQAFDNLTTHLEKMRFTTEGSYIKAPDVIPPEVGAHLRKQAAEMAGIKSPLKESSSLEPNFIRDEAKSEPFPDYQMQGTTSFAKTAEVKQLKQMALKLKKAYEDARDAAKIQSMLKPGEAVELSAEGHHYRAENRIQKEYSPPKEASAKEKVGYKGHLADLNREWRAAADKLNDELKPSIKGLTQTLKKKAPELSQILSARKPIIEDPRVLEAADKLGCLDEVYGLLKHFLTEESGASTAGFAADVVQTSTTQLLKAASRGAKLARKLGLTPELTMRICANEFTHDIYKRTANPIFVADYEKQLGELALATHGVEMPRTPEGIEAWFTLKKDDDILGSTHLDGKQKAALIRQNEVKEKTAKIIKQEMADLYEKAEEAGDKVTPFSGYGAQIRAMKYDLQQNWERPHEKNLEIIGNATKFIAHNTVNSVQLGNFGLHAIHVIEGHTAFQSSSPWGFAKAVALYAKRDKEALSFARAFNMKLPQWGMREDSMNPLTSGYAKAQNSIIKLIPGSQSKLARTASEVVSGRGMEQQKMVIGLLTASHYAAKEMRYKGGAVALRQAIVHQTISAEDRLAAATHIMKFMGRTIGAGPAGYTHMNVIDRAAQEVGGVARVLAPFTRSLQTQSAFFNRELVDGANALGKGDLPKALSHFSTVLHATAIAAMWSGSAAMPLMLRDNLPPDKREMLENILDRCAIIGDTLGIRSTHTRPEPMWLVRTGENLISQGIKNVKALNNPNASDNSKRHAGIMLAGVLTGVNNIADTISFEVLAKMYGHYDEAKKLGGNTKWVYTEPGPFGITEGKYVASRLYPEANPFVAGAKAALHIGEEKDKALFERDAARNYKAEIDFKNTFGNSIHDALRENWYVPAFETSETLRHLPEKAKKYSVEISSEQLQTLRQKQLAQRQKEEEAAITFMGEKMRPVDFWTKTFEYFQKNPEKATMLRNELDKLPGKQKPPNPAVPVASAS